MTFWTSRNPVFCPTSAFLSMINSVTDTNTTNVYAAPPRYL